MNRITDTSENVNFLHTLYVVGKQLIPTSNSEGGLVIQVSLPTFALCSTTTARTEEGSARRDCLQYS